ncbi:MAG: putative purine permease YbbY [Pelotomaculum sp. PtaB.Bin013]|uniref:Purine/pyrimidine permease n=1 Tax=Pelotomaculum isophthalicicum JI TaxID=947010 RepID=A0A9X4H4Z6_9FIRM|nr:solute carrier family 23 protein [Pelotomaculum isophthalicicum]MDF9408057.1 purine/pyrimidine permease [Pelotomaculum isophthalicicum JI]OPX89979.1 MAG: putative purine permease YbbY [Pelotomaculum sp. PtaB.Bin013]
MSKMAFKYGLDDVPPPLELILFGLQWLAISVPTIVIIGKVVADFHYNSNIEQVIYVQKIFFVTAIALLTQVLLGHRLPIVTGPATVLLVGVAASTGSDSHTVYSSIMIGGIILSLIAVTGLFGRLKKLFTPRVVAVILILIAFTLAPTIMNLIITPVMQASSLFNLIFTLVFLFIMFVCGKYLTGIWKSTIIIWSLLTGSLIYFLFFPDQMVFGHSQMINFSAPFSNLFNFELSVNPAVVVSFLICFLALSINDLGSIQSVGELIEPDEMEKRITRGLSITGLANGLSGLLGIVGIVNFSMSPGVIASTACASRYTMVPAALGLLAISFFPKAVEFVSLIPRVVIGSVLIYVMCSQVSAGLMVALKSAKIEFDDGLVMGLPFMLGIVVSFLPGDVLGTFPVSLRPLLGNGFVVGVLVVLFLDHVVYRSKT